MAPLSWNEIRRRAIAFSKDWESESSESAEAKTFWDSFFNVFGVTRRRIASFEKPVKKSDGQGGYVDLLWKGTLLVEHKSRGKNLDSAFRQALDYFPGLKEAELPRFVIVSDFEKFRLHDLDEDKKYEFALTELHQNIHLFGFIAGYQTREFKPQDPVNIEASERLGKLHNKLFDVGYEGHVLEVLMVRLLFCLFSEDTGIFDKNEFQNYIEYKTSDDGSDLAQHLSSLFHVLDSPQEKRLKNLDETLAAFPYIDGRLFEEVIPPASFDSEMRKQLLNCCELDWSKISPAIFGSLFQSVMNLESRRKLGAHYTTEDNIKKVIDPLFMDELNQKFEKIKSNKKKLLEFHNDLSKMKFFDPACGCGNFLVIAYRELRILEVKILRQLYKKGETSQFLDISTIILLDVDQFYGIEIEEFPAQIAQTALWMMDHQMNVYVSQEFGQYFSRLPLKKAPSILHANALDPESDWEGFVHPTNQTFILSNPPFVGKQFQNDYQKKDMAFVFDGVKGAKTLDYVSCWYIRAAQLMNKHPSIKAAYVSTNSICQGEQVGILWPELIAKYHIEIYFAHQTFKWGSDVKKGKAAVHCVIIGFANQPIKDKKIFEYDSDMLMPKEINAKNINPYLIDAPTVLLENRKAPICSSPKIVFGNMPNDGRNLLLSDEDREKLLQKEPKAKKWIKPFLGADEFLNGVKKWCLWLVDIKPNELKQLKEVSKRVAAVKKHRLDSERPSTNKLARYPTLFGEIRQPISDYILIPRVTSEKRLYIPIGFFSKDNIIGDTNLCIPNANLFHFGVLTSHMHMAWVRAVCGRLKSDYRYSNQLVYNNFPWPVPDEKSINSIVIKAKKVLDVRSKYPDSNLASLYDPLLMPKDLVKAHQELDKVVDLAYSRKQFKNDNERLEHLFVLYNQYTHKELVSEQQLKPDLEKEYDIDEVRLMLSSLIVDKLHKSKNFGRTKFAKVFYLTDMTTNRDLKTKYYREAAGPVDYEVLYDKSSSIEKIGKTKACFSTRKRGERVYFIPEKNINEFVKDARLFFADDFDKIMKVIYLFENLDIEQAEIVATLFACWNDCLLENVEATDKKIIDRVWNNWHMSKQRFSAKRLKNALDWMKENEIVPEGTKSHTSPKPFN